LKLPGMLNAAIKDCPVFGGKLRSYDESKIAGMPGVKKVVRVKDTAVAVVADTWWRAKKALDALPIVWDEGEAASKSSATIADMLKEGLNATTTNGDRQNGDALKAIGEAAKAFADMPVKMIWSREEDQAHDFYRPISQSKLSAGLDAEGNLVGLHVRVSGQSINAMLNPKGIVDGKDMRQLQGYSATPGDA